LFLSIFGITGSILVFYAELDEWLNPSLLTVSAPPTSTPFQTLDDIIAAGKSAMPETAQHTLCIIHAMMRLR
jgi:uncharacterized iron-regulated membrane protein